MLSERVSVFMKRKCVCVCVCEECAFVPQCECECMSMHAYVLSTQLVYFSSPLLAFL